MISLLRGTVIEFSGPTVILDVNGVGYEIYATSKCIEQLSVGTTATIVIYTEVKEDLIRLHGFTDRLEKQVFLLLKRVKGVGPKSASEIVSGIDTRDLLRAIAEGDLNRLQAIRGVGKKTAERIIVELRDKVGEYVIESQPGGARAGIGAIGAAHDAIEALVALGFPRKEAERAAKLVEQQGLQHPADSATIVREALRLI